MNDQPFLTRECLLTTHPNNNGDLTLPSRPSVPGGAFSDASFGGGGDGGFPEAAFPADSSAAGSADAQAGGGAFSEPAFADAAFPAAFPDSVAAPGGGFGDGDGFGDGGFADGGFGDDASEGADSSSTWGTHW